MVPMMVPAQARKELMKKLLSSLVAIALTALPLSTSALDSKNRDRLENCGMVMDDILRIPEDIPARLMDKAECVVVIPSVVTVAFIGGGSYGRGAMTCRSGEHFDGSWSAPAMMALEGGSVGFQAGAQATDFIFLVMNPRGAMAILNNKVKLGGDIAAAAGPKGRDVQADTDVSFRAEMLTYSRARGLFAGVSVEGSTLRPDNGANEDVYGKKISAADIVRTGEIAPPAAAQQLLELLNKHSPHNDSDRNSIN
jgi:lipid-binding SYLF domain-containing protein